MLHHPAIPADLLAEFGEPELAFGPNRRFRTRMAAVGVVALMFGVVYVLLDLGVWVKLPLADWFSRVVAIAIGVGGAVVLYGVWRWPTSWVFVCPRGLVRKRGHVAWESRDWSEAVRFEDATLGHKGITIRQSRLVWNFGPDWGFIADSVADYDRLCEALRQKVPERGTDR